MSRHPVSSRWYVPVAYVAAIALGVAGTAAAKTIVGSPRADTLRGTHAADRLEGRSGNDRLYGYGGHDRLFGGSGSDRIYAGRGNDVVVCGTGRDLAFVDGNDRVGRDCERVRRTGAGPSVLRSGPLVPGKYVSAVSRPRVRLTVGSGWRVAGRPSGEEFTLTRAGGFADAFGHSRLPTGTVAGVVARLSAFGTVAAAPAPVSIGGRHGQRFDLVGPSASPCGTPGSSVCFGLGAADSARVWVLDRGGWTINIVAKAPTSEFPAYVELVERVLSTFVFE